MSTSTPPPYFPQNTLSPADKKARRNFFLALIGCGGLAVLVVIAAIIALIFFMQR